ncbi:ATP-binding protein [Craterilacuibacter sp.]|uniref:ATP-binding protein n=1 Tax=Craterilacuibacter sp. TaxID=2870909 RepID=UPI003F2C3DA8
MPVTFSSLFPGDAGARIIRLRWLMLLAASVLLCALRWRGIVLPWALCAQALATLAVINLALQFNGLARWRGINPLALGLFADVLALTEILAFSGGAANPLASLYLPPILFAALLLPVHFAWTLGGLSLLAYGSLFFWHLPWPLAGDDAAYAFTLHLVGMWLTFALSMVLIIGFVSRLAGELVLREAALSAAREAQLRNEQLVALGVQAASAAHTLSTPLGTLSLLADELADSYADDPELGEDLRLMQQQLAVCRAGLSRLREDAEVSGEHLPLFDALAARIAGWRTLRPDVALHWQGPQSGGPLFAADHGFWAALFNLLNNAADAGGGKVELAAALEGDSLQLAITNREGCLSAAQLARAGLAMLPSDKPAGMGIGVLLSHVTLSRLGGSLTLSNDQAGGVRASLCLPLSGRAP